MFRMCTIKIFSRQHSKKLRNWYTFHSASKLFVDDKDSNQNRNQGENKDQKDKKDRKDTKDQKDNKIQKDIKNQKDTKDQKNTKDQKEKNQNKIQDKNQNQNENKQPLKVSFEKSKQEDRNKNQIEEKIKNQKIKNQEKPDKVIIEHKIEKQVKPITKEKSKMSVEDKNQTQSIAESKKTDKMIEDKKEIQSFKDSPKTTDKVSNDDKKSQIQPQIKDPPEIINKPQVIKKEETPRKRPKHLIAVHCGYHNPIYQKHIKAALEVGYKALETTGRSLEAVEVICRMMESDKVFNCGKGSVLNTAGVVEMEASVMDGETLRSGAVSGLNNIEHPVTLAKMVMDKTPHISIAGRGANQFAQALGFPRIPPAVLVTEEEKEAYAKHYEEYPGFATAIALDPDGNLATAMSSGGMRRKLPGRVGCCSMVGTGYYADNRIAAVTCSDNPAIMKASLAYDIVHYIDKGLSPAEAAQKMLMKMQLRLYIKGGAMVVTKYGDVAISLTQDKMDWAFKRDGEYKFGDTEGFFQYNG